VKLPRWRLRTALLLVAILSIPMGIAAFQRRRFKQREAALRAIDRKHGTYGVRISGPSWFRSIVIRVGGNETMFYDPRRVSLGPGNSGYDFFRPIVDRDIAELTEHLANFSNLEHLDLRYNGWLTDRGIESLPPLSKLKRIDLKGTAVSEEGIAHLLRRYPGCEVKR
jgi:hypothetical protein